MMISENDKRVLEKSSEIAKAMSMIQVMDFADAQRCMDQTRVLYREIEEHITDFLQKTEQHKNGN